VTLKRPAERRRAENLNPGQITELTPGPVACAVEESSHRPELRAGKNLSRALESIVNRAICTRKTKLIIRMVSTADLAHLKAAPAVSSGVDGHNVRKPWRKDISNPRPTGTARRRHFSKCPAVTSFSQISSGVNKGEVGTAGRAWTTWGKSI